MAEAVAEEATPQTKKRSLGKMLLLGINVLLFLAGAAFFLSTKFGFFTTPVSHESSAATASQGAKAPEATEASKTVPSTPLVAVPVSPFVVNLSGDNGRRYLRVVMQLLVKNDKAREDIEKNSGQIRDRLIFLLSNKTFEDIAAVQGKYQLQSEICQSVNDVLGSTIVEKAYFTEFVVQ